MLVSDGQLDEAFQLIQQHLPPISNRIEHAIIQNYASLNDLNDKLLSNVISNSEERQIKAEIISSLLRILVRIPKEIEIQQKIGKLRGSLYTVTDQSRLERILGETNRLLPINWLEKALVAAKSVCQVIRADGVRGTGFLTKNGYLMTNFHVLSSKEDVRSARILFDYEADLLGNYRTTSEFFLEPDDAKFSAVDLLDYAYVRVSDNAAAPLAGWRYLEIDAHYQPQIDEPVTIIQHPLGQRKQIALTANQVIGMNGNKLFYKTDTERGSSGSPVFNNDWKVIALHHAGRREQDGGLVINPVTGERRGANEGILFKYIVQELQSIV